MFTGALIVFSLLVIFIAACLLPISGVCNPSECLPGLLQWL